MVRISSYFGKDLWCKFTQMLNEKKKIYFKVGLQVNYTTQQT